MRRPSRASRKSRWRIQRPAVYRGWASALRLTGAYEEALSTIQRFESREPASVALSNLRGEILYETGRIAEAREAFEKAVTGKAQDALDSRAQSRHPPSRGGKGRRSPRALRPVHRRLQPELEAFVGRPGGGRHRVQVPGRHRPSAVQGLPSRSRRGEGEGSGEPRPVHPRG